MVGDKVNCERALAAHTRFGGHFVQVRAHLRLSHAVDRSLNTNPAADDPFIAPTPFLTQGHVDSTAQITSVAPDGNSLRLTFQLTSTSPLTPTLLPSLIPKGYVTIDGASLTLTNVDDSTASFSVMLIAHSQEKLVLSTKKVGDKVNIEVDSVGKFVEKAVRSGLESVMEGKGEGGGAMERMVERVVERVLREKGVLPSQ